jgi:hypothetical protein
LCLDDTTYITEDYLDKKLTIQALWSGEAEAQMIIP